MGVKMWAGLMRVLALKMGVKRDMFVIEVVKSVKMFMGGGIFVICLRYR